MARVHTVRRSDPRRLLTALPHTGRPGDQGHAVRPRPVLLRSDMIHAAPSDLPRPAIVDPSVLPIIEALARRQARLDYATSQSSG